MGAVLEAVAELERELVFGLESGSHRWVSDYPLQADGKGEGPRPLEMLLASLAACAGGSLAVLLRKQGQAFTALRVRASGRRRDEHPTGFESIQLAFEVAGPGLDEARVRAALDLSEARICPVWAMLKPGVAITASLVLRP